MVSSFDFFAAARDEFHKARKLFDVALSVEASKLEFAIHAFPGTVVQRECRLKEFDSIRDNFIRYQGEPSREVSFDELLKSCTDLIGLRVVSLYNADLADLEECISSAFGLELRNRAVSEQDIRRTSEFGYRATHWKYQISDPFLDRHLPISSVYAEIQLRSVLSDAWARHSKYLLHKSKEEPADELVREFSIASATIEGLDNKLDQLLLVARQPVRRPYSEEVSRLKVATNLGEMLGAFVAHDDITLIASLLEFKPTTDRDVYDDFEADANEAWKKFCNVNFADIGISEPFQKLKAALFAFNSVKYEKLVSPHQRTRVYDYLITS